MSLFNFFDFNPFFSFNRWTKLEANHFGFDNDGNRNDLFFSFNMGK